MKPINETTMIKPLTAGIELTDAEWHDEDTISYYIPIWFNPDEYFNGIHVNTPDSDDYINLYILYNHHIDTVELEICYFNCSAVEGESPCFEIRVVLDKETELYLRNLLSCDYEIILQKAYKKHKEKQCSKTGNDDENHIRLEAFEEYEFYDAEYMKELLSEKDYKCWETKCTELTSNLMFSRLKRKIRRNENREH